MALGLVHGWLAVICLLASCVSAQLKSSVPITPLLELQAGRVIPDVANNLASPSKNVTISYAGGATVGYGNELQVLQTQTAPTVDVINGSDSTGLYTLILQDPDVPDPATATGATYVHWLVVNISGAATTNVTSTGVVLAPYAPPAPNSGLHRYVFTLFKQNASVPILNVNITRVFGRPKVFALTYSLGDPVAAKYFVAQPAGPTNLTNTTVPETVEVQQLLKGKVIPNVVPLFNPLARLNVSYTNGSLDYGQILLPEQVASQPAVYVQGLNPGTIYNSTFPYFTLAIVDPDAPDPTAPTSSLILHLLKVNIPTNTPASNILSNTTGGNVLQAYRGPSPPSGLHRYTFLLYGQGRLSNASAPASRSLFNISSFALNNTLGLPLAAFYFNSIRAANATTPAPTSANATNGTVTPVTPSPIANATAPAPTTANRTNGTVTPATPAPTAGPTLTPSATTGASPTPSETAGPTPTPSPTAAPAPASA